MGCHVHEVPHHTCLRVGTELSLPFLYADVRSNLMNHDVTLTSSLPFYTPEFDLDAGENTADTTEAEAEAERDGAGSSCQLFTSCTELVGSQEQDEIYIRSVAMGPLLRSLYIYIHPQTPPPPFSSLKDHACRSSL